ncbi:hypothetical protein MKW92_018383 [Papaver armeniacum]|nr:hypothetical protein MKW92_018383 [Papaver armeniacum]
MMMSSNSISCYRAPVLGTLLPKQFPSSFLKTLNPNFTSIIPIRKGDKVSKRFSSIVSCKASLGDITKPDFPILHQEAGNGKKLVFLDNASTSQKPHVVLKAINDYYSNYNANVHRGLHSMTRKATDEYELARKKVANFVNAPQSTDIVFIRNATEAISLVAYSWGLANLKPGDVIILTVAEHHSALVPWQIVARKTGASLKFVGLTQEENPDVLILREMITKKTRLVVVHHVSNNGHRFGAKVLVDACQSVPHMVVDMCGPTGIGFLYGKSELLSAMPPFLGGGEMIADVFLDNSTYAEPPSRFEAGTPAIGETIGLGAAVDYLSGIGMQKIHDYEIELADYLYKSLRSIPNIRIYGPAPSRTVRRAALCAFNIDFSAFDVDANATDIVIYLDSQHAVATQSGNHCAQPLHSDLDVNSSARASLYFYNTKEDVDTFIEALKDTINFFKQGGKQWS